MKLSAFVLVFAVVSSALASPPVRQQSFQLEYSPADVTLEHVVVEGRRYDRISLRGAPFVTETVGGPALPTGRAILILPRDARSVAVARVDVCSAVVATGSTVMPRQPDLITGSSDAKPVVVESRSVLDAGSQCTAAKSDDAVQFVGIGDRFGARIAVFRIAPMTYDAAKNELALRMQIHVTVTYFSSAALPFIYYDLPRAQRDELRREAVNPSAILDPDRAPVRASSSPDTTFIVHGLEPARQEDLPYVIVTTQPLVSPFQQLADWRTATGDPARIVTLSWIHQHYAGVDDANRIRNFLLDAFARWNTSWVLLGGDVEQIPSRYGFYDSTTSTYGPTDLYYTGLTGNWNDDGNAVFGESTDVNDIDPDLFIGRAPVSTALETTNFVQKVLAYEQSPPAYVKSALFMAVSGLGSDHDKQTMKLQVFPSNYQIATLYDSFSSYASNATLNEVNAISYVGQGFHIINHMDHSGIDSMGTGAEQGGGALSIADASAFTNGVRQSIVWTYGCEPNAFDYESISEAWMNNAAGGAVAFVGNTRTGWAIQDSQDWTFFNAWFHAGTERIGGLLAATQGMTQGDYYSKAMNLLGDPAMHVWVDQPQALAVTTTGSLQTGMNSLTVSVANLPAGQEATVTFAKPDDNVLITRTTTGGTVTEPIALHTSGALAITARTKDRLPYVGSVPVAQSTASHLYVAGVQIDDTTGNNDQKLEPGESATLLVQLGNGGASTSASGSATLSTISNGVTITTTTAAVPSIATGNSAAIGFPITLSNNFGDGDSISFQLTAGLSTQIVVPVFAPQLEQTHVYADNSNANGIPEPGETISFGLRVINNGFGDAKGVNASLTTTSSNITLITSSISIGTVAAKTVANSSGTFQLSLGPSFSPSSDTVMLTMTDSLGNTVTRPVELRVPAPPSNLRTRGNANGIKVIWDPSMDPLARKYAVYRGPSGGPYSGIETFLLRDASFYDDRTATGSQSYGYQITAIDQFGNESAASTVQAIPSLSEDANFPRSVRQSDGTISGHIAVYDVDGDGQKEIFALTHSTQMGPGKLYAWRSDGTALIQIDDPNLAEFAHLDGAGVGTPAFGDIDGDHHTDIVVNGLYKIYAFHADGSAVAGWQNGVDIPQFATCTGQPTVNGTSPVLVDLDGDHKPEIVTTSYDWINGCDGGNAHLYVFSRNGTLIKQHDFPGSDYSFGTPAFGDLDKTGRQDVVFAMLGNGGGSSDLWVLSDPFTLSKIASVPGAIWCNEVALGDLDGDGYLDIVAASQATGLIYAFDRHGNPLNGWQGGVPIDAGDHMPDNYAFSDSIALADADCDGKLDVIVAGEEKVYIFNNNGTRRSGWPVPRDGRPGPSTSPASPLIADLDGDADLDVLIASVNTNGEGTIEAWDVQSAQPVTHFPLLIDDGIFRTPAVADIDNDGRVEVVAGAGAQLHVWPTAGFGRPAILVWPQIHRDALHSSTSPVVNVNRSYLTSNQLFCAQALFSCALFSRPYEDACGCGCLPVNVINWPAQPARQFSQE